MSYKLDRKSFLGIQIFLFLIWLILYIFQIENVSLFRGLLIFQYFFCLVCGFIRFKLPHSYLLFLLSFTLFLLSIVIFDGVDGVSMYYASKFIAYSISTHTVILCISIFFVSLVGINIGSYFAPSKERKYRIEQYSQYDLKKIRKIAFVVILLCMPLCIMKLKHDYIQILSNGYLALFTDLESAPLIYRIGWFLCQSLLPILFLCNAHKRTFYCLILLFLLLNFLDLLKGARGAIFRPLAFFLWYYYKFYTNNKGISIKMILVFVCALLLISTWVLESRGDVIGANLVDIPSITQDFVLSQGVSYYVNIYYIDYSEKLIGSSHFYILSPIVDFVARFFNPVLRERSVSCVEQTLSIDHKLTYAISPDLYLNGNGLGSSFIIELYAIAGFLTLLLGCVCLGYLIVRIETKLSQSMNSISIIFAWFWIQNLIWMPRGSILAFVPLYLTAMVFFYLISLGLRITSKKIYSTDKIYNS